MTTLVRTTFVASLGPIHGLLLDLFGTLVFFDGKRLPRVRVTNEERVVTIEGLADLLAGLSPAIDITDFLAAATAASLELETEKKENHLEFPSAERFRRTLVRLGVAGDVEAAASELSRRHMAGLEAAVVCPEDRSALLASLASSYRLALVSNFDDASTAHRLLARHDLLDHFDSVIVSEAIGLRKPHVRLFETACAEINLPAHECLHVGDSYDADVRGAVAAGVRALWVDKDSGPFAPALDRIADVAELPAWLERGLSSH